jgi:phenylacetate-CoA ligase
MPGQAKALVEGLRREGIPAVPIATNLLGSALAQRLDRIRFVRTFLRGPVFLTRLLRHAPNVDVLHVNTCSGLYFFLFGTTSILLGRLLGKRTVLHYHSGAAREFLSTWGWAAAPTIRLANAVIVPSAFLEQVFESFGWRTIVVPNICELDRYMFRQRVAAPRLIVARHLEKTYNVACTLRAFAKIRKAHGDATLVVLGGGPEESSLRALAGSLGIADAVTFTGYVDNARVPEYFDRASIFVNTSNTDNMPISILEAFAAGLPVVSTRAGGIPVLVEHDRTGLLVPLDDDDALAAQVQRLLIEPGLAERLTTAARQVAEAFAWKRIFPMLAGQYAPLAFTEEPPSASGERVAI